MNLATPGEGDILYDINYRPNKHHDEIKAAGILNSILGGDITLLEEVNTPGTKRPDYVWRGKMWGLKTVSSEKAADRAMRGSQANCKKSWWHYIKFWYKCF